MTEGRLTYTFGPLERRGILGPVRAGQAAVLAAGALLAIVALDSSPSAAGAVLALLAFTIAVVATWAPVAGRTAQDWAPVVARFAVRRLRFLSPAPSVGRLAETDAVAPVELRGVRIMEVSYQQRRVGVLAEQSGRRLTAVIACRVLAFSLLDPEAQERRLARWGLILSGAGDSTVRRIQWIERTAPSQGDQLARWVQAERDPAIPPRGTPMIESYLELIGDSARVTQEHEILLAVQVDSSRMRDRDAVVESLLEETERVVKGLQGAEIKVLGALNAGHLARALRTAFDPYARAELAALETADPGRDGLAPDGAWPLATDESWDHYRTDGAVHATYWIASWPRTEVSPMFMHALLGSSSAVRSVAVTFEPLALDRSTREVEAAITRDRADRELRSRFGQSETARQRQAREATARREAELAAGHGEVRLSGFVTISGRDPDDLRRSCAEVLDHAARAHLELRRLYGQQAEAFTFTLPLGRGLR
ncbi:MAG: SCO6880 family protein [Solirubrobacteraceae bacterium]